MKYWDINKILPYQRIYNFINGPRSIGKTYTLLKWCIKQFLKKGHQFVYICRTQDEKKSGVLERACEKVLAQEYPELDTHFDMFAGYINKDVFCYCIALSESIKIKKQSFPGVHYIIFDEYMIEEGMGRYVSGWKEPDLFLSIFHTVDREEQRVKAFLLGNNTTFYNPYHQHKVFKIPMIADGTIWTSKSTLFQRAKASTELEEDRKNNLFIKSIQGSDYGEYALSGDYVEDNFDLIEPLSHNVKYLSTFRYNGFSFGFYKDIEKQLFIMTDKVDETYFKEIALSVNDITASAQYFRVGEEFLLKTLVGAYKAGLFRYSSMEVKSKIEDGIIHIVR